jgi:hypothetical protein
MMKMKQISLGVHSSLWLQTAKSATASEGNWAGFWGNDAIDQKLHDIAGSGPVVLAPIFPNSRSSD